MPRRHCIPPLERPVPRAWLKVWVSVAVLSSLQVHCIATKTQSRLRASRRLLVSAPSQFKKNIWPMVLPQKQNNPLYDAEILRVAGRHASSSSRYLRAPALLQVAQKTRSTPEEGGEAVDPCAVPEGGEAVRNPLCPYFHKSWRGANLTVAQMPVHQHEFLADLTGKTKVEKDASENFLRGAPTHTYGSSWVKPCKNYPYCTNPPAPPPLVPPPWQIAGPAPASVYPSLAEPEYPLPWKLAQKLAWLNRQPQAVRDKLYAQKSAADKSAKKLFADNYQKGIVPQNPERMDLRQYPLGPTDMQRWYRSYAQKDKFKA